MELVHFIIRMLQLECCHFDFTCLKEMTVSSTFQNQCFPAANVLVMSPASVGARKTQFVVLYGAVHINHLVYQCWFLFIGRFPVASPATSAGGLGGFLPCLWGLGLNINAVMIPLQ